LNFSLRAEFPLSSKLSVNPIVAVNFPLTFSYDYFRFYSVTAGVKIYYDLSRSTDTLLEYEHALVPVLVAREITPASIPRLEASIEAFGRNTNGIEEPVIRLEVTNVKAKVAFPFLNYVFFEEGSSDIQKRYETFQSAEVAQQKFKGTTDRSGEKILDLYHEMLNILGSRLKAFPRAKITLNGSTSNSGVETGNIGLARKRAETIKNYLMKVWQIDPERISVAASVLPAKPSPQGTKEGQEENRRVEILSSEESITDPVIVTNTEHYATPSEIKLSPHIVSEAGIQHLLATVNIGSNELIRYEGNMQNLAKQKDWAVTEEALSGQEDSLLLLLQVTDSAGTTVSARNTIGLRRMKTEREKEQELERFSLILFNFDEDVLGAKNERTISLVAESFKRSNTSSLKIVGYTDETGDPNYNDDLSRRRAQEAAQYLERMLRAKRITFPAKTLIEGKGSRERLFDNSLPEGRFFSRTVNVTLEKGK
jgi:outer membrane protein OmpA-like peptidoglycan-associated protein